MSSHPYAVLDVFTDKPLEGNPLAVFTEAQSLSSEQMQRLARELNLSETAFLLPADLRDADARVRIFTPATELPFAGHPVLGSASVIAQRSGKASIALQTGAGLVPVRFDDRRESTFAEMDQPLPTKEEPPQQSRLLAALDLSQSELPIRAYRNGPLHVYVALRDVNAVTALRPDLTALAQLNPCCVSCFALSKGTRHRVKARVFCPGLGVPEDPATGSAAGPLALHLALNDVIPFGEQLEIHQGEEVGRPSILFARVEGSAEDLRAVKVGGSSVLVARGEYRVA